ncbi:MAG: metal ABC transporter permease [Spirochaetaceae bacterium]|nr:metal ABC transporter permease [Spirochaetaceae bacterium]
MLNLLTYPPIWRGLVVLLFAAASFPIAGVWVIRLNLLPYRFMLMHGAMLGGAVGLTLGISPLPTVMAVNIILVLLADVLSNRGRLDAGLTTIFLMVASLGGAMALLYGAAVPAQDALGLLWGNLFAVSPTEIAATILFCLGLALFGKLYGLRIQAVIFDRDVAFTSGVDDAAVMRALLIVIGLTVAFAMRIIGALLLDALLLIPAIIASVGAPSLKALYRRAVLIGMAIGVGGFILALLIDLPVGAATALLGAAALAFVLVTHTFFQKELI